MFCGDKLRQVREENEMTQTELAKKLGTTQGGIGNYENGRRSPNEDIVLELCRIFNVQRAYFFDNQEIDKVRELIDRLKGEGVLQESGDVNGEVADLILNAIRMEISLEKIKKGQGK